MLAGFYAKEMHDKLQEVEGDGLQEKYAEMWIGRSPKIKGLFNLI